MQIKQMTYFMVCFAAIVAVPATAAIRCTIRDYVVRDEKLVQLGRERKAVSKGVVDGWWIVQGSSKVSPNVVFSAEAYAGRTSLMVGIHDKQTGKAVHEQVSIDGDMGTLDEEALNDGKLYLPFLGARNQGSPGALGVSCERDG